MKNNIDVQTPRAIILVTLDACRADHLGCWGYPLQTSPFMDQLANENVCFEYAFSPIPYTTPSHASILTGKYPRFHSIGFSNSNKPLIRANETTLPQILSELGYKTAAFVSITPLLKCFGLDLGFDFYDDTLTQLEVNSIDHTEFSRRSADQTTTAVLKWLVENKAAPFFLWVHFSEPHGPYSPPDRYSSIFRGDPFYGSPRVLDIVPDGPHGGGISAYQALNARYDADGNTVDYQSDLNYYLAQYDGQIRFVDHQLKILADNLKYWGLYDEIMLIITADHGEAFGENNCYCCHGWAVTLDQIRVPLIIKLPSQNKVRAQRFLEPVSLLDLMPTILGFCGFERQYLGLHGLNLRPILSDINIPWPDRYIFSEFPPHFSIVHDRFQLLGEELGNQILTEYPHVPPDVSAIDGIRLYDYRADPQGKNNLTPDQPNMVARLKGIAESYFRIPNHNYLYDINELELADSVELKQRLKLLGYG